MEGDPLVEERDGQVVGTRVQLEDHPAGGVPDRDVVSRTHKVPSDRRVGGGERAGEVEGEALVVGEVELDRMQPLDVRPGQFPIAIGWLGGEEGAARVRRPEAVEGDVVIRSH